MEWSSHAYRIEHYDKILPSYLKKVDKLSPDEVAYVVGKKCLRRGPFAYFLTPAWKYKLKANWFPVEVNVMQMQAGANSTLAKLVAMNEGERQSELELR